MYGDMIRRLIITGRAVGRLLPVLALLGAVAIDVAAFIGRAYADQSGSLFLGFERCRTIMDDAARLRCYESSSSKPAANVTRRALGQTAGSWRLVRTHNLAGGPDVISIMQTADIAKSDIDVAGLMLRCGETGVEVVVVLVRPLSLRTHPKVVTSIAGKSAGFVATVMPPGAGILLPKEASELAAGPWTAGGELSVQIDARDSDDPILVHGVIPLTGLGGALPSLLANCATQ
jgi:hypothetical protein